MSRSAWKNFFTHFIFLKKNMLFKNQVTIWSRSSVLTKIFINKKILVHTGKSFKKIYINNRKIFFKSGEFCPTRCKFFHKNKVKPLKKNIKNKLKKK